MSAQERLAFVTVLIGVIAIGWSSISYSRIHKTPAPSATAPVSGSEIIEGYKGWTRVNPEPAMMHSAVAILCARPTVRQSRIEAENPHRDKFITVYVNDIGRHAMMEQKVPSFPQNSVIVKEKLTNKDSFAPELLTVMVKREAGYNVENGDWEYMVFDGSGKSVRALGKLEACQGCHMKVKSTDYVSRNYLPYEVRQKLK